MQRTSITRDSRPALVESKSASQLFFENAPDILGVNALASLLGISTKTIYDWKYRRLQKGVPKDLFLKFNRKLYVRTEALRRWIVSQNPSF